MTSYEMVKRAIEFKSPERVPMNFPWFSDFYGVGYKPLEGERHITGEGKDEWDCIWERTKTTNNMGQVKQHPLRNWEVMKTYKFPNPNIPERFNEIEEALEKADKKYVLSSSCYTLFERMHMLRGFTEILQDFYLHPREVHKLADRILDFQIGIVRNLGKFKEKIHGFWMTDDWGTQNATIISLSLWRKFFKFRYKKVFDEIHKTGMHAILHSCGKVNNFIDEFIEIGLDAINLQQPTLLGIEEVGEKFRGRICFVSLVDIQKTLPCGTPEEIRHEAKLLLDKWGTPKGGFIVSDYGKGEAIGVTEERKRIMFDTFVKYGKLK